MKTRTGAQTSKVSIANTRVRPTTHPHGSLVIILATFAVVLAMVGLSSCTAYTSSANSTKTEDATSPGLSTSTSSVDFGKVLLNSTASQAVTLTNSGTAAISIDAPTIAGSGFTMASTAAQTIDPAQTVSFQVTFKPGTASTFTGTVMVADKTSKSHLHINLSGTGTSTQAQIAFSPGSVNFSGVNVGSTGTQSVTLTNTGNAALNISSAKVSGPYATNLPTPVTVNAGAQKTFTVTFTPTAEGNAAGGLSISSNASLSTTTVGLSGTGMEAEGAANPTSVSFGSVAVGTADSVPVTVKNNGNMTLGFSNIGVTGTGMSVTGISTSTQIAAGASLTFNARFAPTGSGGANGAITMATNGSPADLSISLTGTGAATTTVLSANPTSLPFGSVTDDGSRILTTSLTNNGNSNVTISAITVSGAGFTTSGVPNGTTLTPGQSTTLSVTFAPTSPGAVNGARVSIASNSTTSPMAITLTGTGTHAVVLQWNADSGATGYEVFRGTVSGSEGSSPLNASPISATSYTDTNVASGATYFYTVKAVNSSGSSSASNETAAAVPTP